MIRHICMFTLKEENKENTILEFLNRAEKLRELEMIRRFEVVRNDEKTPASNYDVSLIFDFNSVEDLDEYQKSKLHLEFGEFVGSVRIDRACIDYEFEKKYPVVTLCGSTRFKNEFIKVQKKLTLEGCIVISVGLFGHSGDEEVWENMDEGTLTKTKEMLDDMHKRKIDMADEIFVINVGDYIGDSTRSEIAYAREHGKKVRFLEEHKD